MTTQCAREFHVGPFPINPSRLHRESLAGFRGRNQVPTLESEHEQTNVNPHDGTQVPFSGTGYSVSDLNPSEQSLSLMTYTVEHSPAPETCV